MSCNYNCTDNCEKCEYPDIVLEEKRKRDVWFTRMKTEAIESLLQTTTYDKMTSEQKILVAEYETERLKPRVDELKKSLPVSEIENQIHNWWLDYQIADETEENLLAYVRS